MAIRDSELRVRHTRREVNPLSLDRKQEMIRLIGVVPCAQGQRIDFA